MEKVLILDNYDSFTYNLAHYVESNANFEAAIFRNNEISLEEVNSYKTIILSPGPGLPKDSGILKDLIKTYASSKKILGVCLGMQAIGEVFGATLNNMETVSHGIASPIKVIDREDLIFNNLPSSFNTGRYHSWIVDKNNFPETLLITSEDDKGQIMSFRHEVYKVYGVQFHPESILTEYGKEMITNFLSI